MGNERELLHGNFTGRLTGYAAILEKPCCQEKGSIRIVSD